MMNEFEDDYDDGCMIGLFIVFCVVFDVVLIMTAYFLFKSIVQ